MARVKLSEVKVPPTAHTVGTASPPPLTAAPSATSASQPAPSTSVPVLDVAANPLNDRADFSGVPDLVEDIRERGQMSACSVITREAFLRIYPPGFTDEVHGRTIEPATAIGDARYVIVGGSQRRLAILEIDPSKALKIDIQDDLAATRADFLAATTAENLKRKDTNSVEVAHSLRRLARELGSNVKAGEKLGFSEQVTSQRLSVLNLSEQMQALVSDGTIPYRIARKLGPLVKAKNLTPEQQLAEWGRIQREDLTTVKSSQDDHALDPTKDQSKQPRRSWRITSKQTPTEVAEILLDRFEGQELQDLLLALESLREARNSTPAA